MKTFHLTFTGTVLPRFEESVVRQGLAQLFEIKDEDTLEGLFGGRTVVLASSLERRDAASFYQEVTRLGGKANLVAAEDWLANPDPNALWVNPSQAFEPADTETATDAATPPQPAVKDNPELRRLRALIRKTEQQADQEIARLERTIDRFDHIAEQELARLKVLGEAAEVDAAKALEELDGEEESTLKDIELRREALEENALRVEEEEQARYAELEERQQAAREQEGEDAEALQREIVETQAATEEEIARLQALIETTRREGEAKVEALEKDITALPDLTSERLAALDAERDTIAEEQEEARVAVSAEIQALEKQPELERKELESRREAVDKTRKDSLARIEAMAKEIRDKREEGIEKTRQNLAQAQRKQQRAIGQLKKREKELAGE